MATSIKPYHDIPNDELHKTRGLVIVVRGTPREDRPELLDSEPITICRYGWLAFVLPVLIRDALDIPGAQFQWYELSTASNHVLDSVKARMRESEEINLYLFRLENKF